MKSLSQTDALDERIRLLQRKRQEELLLLREQAHLTYESLKPVNLIKRMLQQISATPEIKNQIASTLLGLATGFLSKRAVMGTSQSPLRRILGTLFQLGIANVVAKHSDSIRLLAEKMLLRLLGRNIPKHEYSSNGNGQKKAETNF